MAYSLKKWRGDNPAKYRVQNFMSALKKTEQPVPERLALLAKVERSLGTVCKYCPTILTVENVSLDHAVPKTRVTEKSRMNALGNLQCVCKECNQVKGDMTHKEFKAILKACLRVGGQFLVDIFRKRMKMATMVYGRRRF